MSVANDYFPFHQRMLELGIIFSFAGYLSEEILLSLGEALKQKMLLDAADAKVTKRVFSSFVKQAQNIISSTICPGPGAMGALHSPSRRWS